jgi:hypothetical protein
MQAYSLKLVQQAGSIHNVFQVSLLEPYVSHRSTAPEPPPSIAIDEKE